MKASIDAGRPVMVDEFPSLADSLGGGIGLYNTITFQMCRALLDEVVLVSESEIAAGIRHAYAQEREVVEGAAAVRISVRYPLSSKSACTSPVRLDSSTIMPLVLGRPSL